MAPNDSSTLHKGKRGYAALLVVLAALAVGACSKSGTQTNPASGTTPTATYQGPAPANADIQSFKLNVWDNVSVNNRCGSCHSSNGASPQAPFFAERTDVNLAYSAALPLMDRDSPEDSSLVTKVAGGHNCWESNNAVCGEIITRWVAAWAGDAGSDEGREIPLEPPASLREPGATLGYPDDGGDLFAATVYPIVRDHCARCHSESAADPESPFFASPSVAASYEAAKDKMDLNNPHLSRMVLRVGEEFHNCWSADCGEDGAALEAAIRQLAGGAESNAPADDLITSMAQRLTEGVVASGGSRYENNLIALWEFKTGSGTTAFDTSGVNPPLNLNMSPTISWVGGWGIAITTGKAQGSTTASKKLRDLITASGEYSVEAWIAPADVVQEDKLIISYSGGPEVRNFTLGQNAYQYDFFSRARDTDGNGEPEVSTLEADRAVQAALQHVVTTFDPVNGRRVYVNGVLKASGGVGDASLADWDDTFAFVLGSEVSGNGQWQGTIRLVAIHNRALTQDQVLQNFAAGVGEKFFLLFNVGDLIDPNLVPPPVVAPKNHYIVVEAARYDSYSYFFNKPTFISLEPNYTPPAIPIAGLRLGINGKEAVAGQSYARLNTTISANNQVLSPYGTTIALERGPAEDEFFLTFERIGSHSNVKVEGLYPMPPAPTPAEASDIGVRTFGEINATLSAITGIARTNGTVATTFAKYQQQLPAGDNIQAFLSSHQMGVAQLTLSYCNALVTHDMTLSAMDPNRFFVGFDFTRGAGSAFDAGGRLQVITPLLNAVANANANSNNGLATQPDTGDLGDMLSSNSALVLDSSVSTASYNSVMQSLLNNDASNTTARTAQVVKGTCAAVLGSAVMLIQ